MENLKRCLNYYKLQFLNYELTNSPYLLKANTRVDRQFSVEQIVLVQIEGPRFCLRMKLPNRP